MDCHRDTENTEKNIFFSLLEPLNPYPYIFTN
jgi:hypothetical protein